MRFRSVVASDFDAATVPIGDRARIATIQAAREALIVRAPRRIEERKRFAAIILTTINYFRLMIMNAKNRVPRIMQAEREKT